MGAQFATTSWSQVLAVGDGEGTASQRALELLCEKYWFPLYAYVRRRGHDADEAADLTQAFFAHLFERHAISRADPGAGRFRSFLLGSLQNFLSHERDRSRALKRGGGATTISLDAETAEDRYIREPADPKTPEEVYERRWAMTVVRRALRSLESEYEAEGKGERARVLRRYLVGDEPRLPYRDVAAQLDMSEGAVKVAVRRMRQRLGRLLRTEIAETLADAEDVDQELRHLLGVLRPFQPKRE